MISGESMTARRGEDVEDRVLAGVAPQAALYREDADDHFRGDAVLGFGPAQGGAVLVDIGPALGRHRRGQEFRIDVLGFFPQEGDFPHHVGQKTAAGIVEGAEDITLVQAVAHQVVFQIHVGHRRGLGPHRRRQGHQDRHQDPGHYHHIPQNRRCAMPSPLIHCAKATFLTADCQGGAGVANTEKCNTNYCSSKSFHFKTSEYHLDLY